MISLMPFFSYYGGKWRIARHYPSPKHMLLYESFAGSAGYSLRFPGLKVKLYDVNPKVYGIWKYLIRVSESEIRRLPLEVEHVDDLSLPMEAKWLIGFWLGKGSAHPKNQPTSWMRGGLRPNSFWGEVIRHRIAAQLKYIRHWEAFNLSYDNAPDVEATWFVDPPYKGKAGEVYPSKFFAYDALAKWCRNRKGQVIACENTGATWLPFRHLISAKSNPGPDGYGFSEEAIWTNEE